MGSTHPSLKSFDIIKDLPVLLVKLFLQLCHFGLKSSDGGLKFGFDLVLHLLEFSFQLFILPLHQLSGTVVLLGRGAFGLELVGKLVNLKDEGKNLRKLHSFLQITKFCLRNGISILKVLSFVVQGYIYVPAGHSSSACH